MSKKDKYGRWVIPQEQLTEFYLGPINYKKYCIEAIKSTRNVSTSVLNQAENGGSGFKKKIPSYLCGYKRKN